ncbi:MAG: uL15 family ribosomal protein [Candidatus Nanoarchaeia archaeon]|nr:uL15 family ribosomal protein [Candidatus Nanoarchaeia archaeon]
MVVHKRKKNTRQRASTTHGWGAKKRHRGAGSHGGVGMAGSGKRAHHKKILILKTFGQEYYGRHGFTSINKRTRQVKKAINIVALQDNLSKFGKKEGDHYIINLRDLGYDKLIGTGNIKYKLKITCDFCSANAKEKIEKAGGEILS